MFSPFNRGHVLSASLHMLSSWEQCHIPARPCPWGVHPGLHSTRSISDCNSSEGKKQARQQHDALRMSCGSDTKQPLSHLSSQPPRERETILVATYRWGRQAPRGKSFAQSRAVGTQTQLPNFKACGHQAPCLPHRPT